ncbi:uncharacterized protein LOC124690075 [Lolium rigidum]|uniref:uncharacterized protein LOC124690075 n=1 Tax=Lolium rigidum TaxID=89674 RepID=UPI001F5CCBDA|nr:uncharacterized protein LOC124690075 [Lolium rigidum]
MKASQFLKQLFSAIVAAVKGRSTATGSKTSPVRTRLVIFSILRNKKLLMSAINSKIHAVMGGRSQDNSEHGNGNHLVAAASSGVGRKAAVLKTCRASEVEKEEGGEGVAKQLQLANVPPGSVIDLARSAAERGGVEFRLEDEIDHVADVFIRKFHDQMKLQKLESFKRFCEMLERN